MKHGIIYGLCNVGKTFLAKYTAACLVKNNINVALVDLSHDRGLYYQYFYNSKYKDIDGLELFQPVSINNVDVFSQELLSEYTIHKFSDNIQASDYDIVLWDADMYFDILGSLNNANYVFMLNSNMASAWSLQSFLIEKIQNSSDVIRKVFSHSLVVYNFITNGKIKLSQLETELMWCNRDGKHISLMIDYSKAINDVCLSEFEQSIMTFDNNCIAVGEISYEGIPRQIKDNIRHVAEFFNANEKLKF